jgi:hypothetical protein
MLAYCERCGMPDTKPNLHPVEEMGFVKALLNGAICSSAFRKLN